ncbi:hypothetical protein XM47_05250 [Catenovulum maritimum]|uniref:Transglutaminase-like domain-containing protein n=2 Tax=Catenovulum maritimum TaxID=1513271 RepID=A0A0J8GY64_9ALTE|nr:hypothetical protein XM47_05250 [Catenovulum maritimum]
MLKKSHLHLILLLVALPFASNAKQLQFEMTKQKGYSQFFYNWLDHQEKQQTLNFNVEHEYLFELFRTMKTYRPKVAKRNVYIALKRTAAKLKTRQTKIIVNKNTANVSFQVLSDNNEERQTAINELLKQQALAQEKYLTDNYYNHYTDSTGVLFVKPDHVRIASESTPIVQSLIKNAQKNFGSLATRDVVNYFLGWIQTIPYSTLENRLTSQGSGFVPPNKLILENQGDCDSKSTLFASVMRALYPHMGIIIIYLPEHALVGLQIPYTQADKYLEIEGNFYVLMEPTGPAVLQAASIAAENERFIEDKNYKVEYVPLAQAEQ